jgi:hypothetical protein
LKGAFGIPPDLALRPAYRRHLVLPDVLHQGLAYRRLFRKMPVASAMFRIKIMEMSGKCLLLRPSAHLWRAAELVIPT